MANMGHLVNTIKHQQSLLAHKQPHSNKVAYDESPYLNLRCLQIQLFSFLVLVKKYQSGDKRTPLG